MQIFLSEHGLNVGKLCQLLQQDGSAGAVCSFTGYMRNHNDGDTVEAMFLDHYPQMTEQALAAIASEAQQRWPLINGLIAHRVGEVKPSDLLVYVEVHTTHRQEAFDACNYIMDTLKTRAPFWKKERTNNTHRWVEPRDSDMSALDKWQKQDV